MNQKAAYLLWEH